MFNLNSVEPSSPSSLSWESSSGSASAPSSPSPSIDTVQAQVSTNLGEDLCNAVARKELTKIGDILACMKKPGSGYKNDSENDPAVTVVRLAFQAALEQGQLATIRGLYADAIGGQWLEGYRWYTLECLLDDAARSNHDISVAALQFLLKEGLKFREANDRWVSVTEGDLASVLVRRVLHSGGAHVVAKLRVLSDISEEARELAYQEPGRVAHLRRFLLSSECFSRVLLELACFPDGRGLDHITQWFLAVKEVNIRLQYDENFEKCFMEQLEDKWRWRIALLKGLADCEVEFTDDQRKSRLITTLTEYLLTAVYLNNFELELPETVTTVLECSSKIGAQLGIHELHRIKERVGRPLPDLGRDNSEVMEEVMGELMASGLDESTIKRIKKETYEFIMNFGVRLYGPLFRSYDPPFFWPGM